MSTSLVKMIGSAATRVMRRLQLEQLTVGGSAGGSTFEGVRRIGRSARVSVGERVEREAEHEEEAHHKCEQAGFACSIDLLGGIIAGVGWHGASSGSAKPLSLRPRIAKFVVPASGVRTG